MSLGWVVSGEDFWKPIEKYVNYFKIRGSYGLVGSDETGLQANPAAAHFLYLDEVNLTGSGGYHYDIHAAYTSTSPTLNASVQKYVNNQF